MPLVRENSQLYEVIKVGTVSGAPLQIVVSGVTTTGGRLETEPLGIPTVARVITVATGNTNTALTSGITRVSIRAVGTNTFYAVGSGAQTATLTGHFIANGERLDIGVPSNSPNIAVICASGASGVLYLSELN